VTVIDAFIVARYLSMFIILTDILAADVIIIPSMQAVHQLNYFNTQINDISDPTQANRKKTTCYRESSTIQTTVG